MSGAIINLSQEERDKFEVWLIQEADQAEALAKQLESLGPAHQAGATRYRAEALAYRVIARRFQMTEIARL